MSELQGRLRRQLAASTDAHQKAELSARICCELARVGQFDEAQRVIADLRRDFGSGRSGRVIVWIMLAEGLLYFFRDQSPLALDRLTRAQFLAINMGYKSYVAVVSAWKAFVESESSPLEVILTSLKLSIAHVERDDWETQMRICIILHTTFASCGELQKARPWFIRGHALAVKNGDQAGIEALVYNAAICSSIRLRVDASVGTVSEDQIRRVRLEIASASNLNMLTQSKALVNHLTYADARTMTVEGCYEKAIRTFEEIRYQGPFPERRFDQEYIDLEICWCGFKLGDPRAIGRYLDTERQFQFTAMDLDDQVVGESMRWELSLEDARFGNSDAIALSRDALMQRYGTEHKATVAAFSAVADGWADEIRHWNSSL